MVPTDADGVQRHYQLLLFQPLDQVFLLSPEPWRRSSRRVGWFQPLDLVPLGAFPQIQRGSRRVGWFQPLDQVFLLSPQSCVAGIREQVRSQFKGGVTGRPGPGAQAVALGQQPVGPGVGARPVGMPPTGAAACGRASPMRGSQPPAGS